MLRSLALLCLVYHVSAQSVGQGVSKSTYSTSDPVAAWTWMKKYLVDSSGNDLWCTPSDECTNNICTCDAGWTIPQGRVYLKSSSSYSCGSCWSHAGCGFGLHHVNVSGHLTTGGMDTATVEGEFTTKLADMDTRYDSFLDYNVVLSTTELSNYKTTFAAAGIKTHTGTWSSETTNTDYTSLLVQVPNTQMVIEFVQASSGVNLTLSADEPPPTQMEQRVSDKVLGTINTGNTALGALAVNRGASSYGIGKVSDFYTGMGATATLDRTEVGATGSASTKKCFLWTGATTEVCYTNRPDTDTKGDFTTCKFEDMLNTVHHNLMSDHPLCGMDKWEDNHYAIDSHTADTSKIVSYIDSAKPYHYCEAAMGPGAGGNSLHYVWDPVGWGIQLDMQFSSAPSDCSSRRSAAQVFPLAENSRKLLSRGTSNPACDASTDCATPPPTPVTTACGAPANSSAL